MRRIILAMAMAATLGGCGLPWENTGYGQIFLMVGDQYKCSQEGDLAACQRYEARAAEAAYIRETTPKSNVYSWPRFPQHYHAPPCVNCTWAGPGTGPAHSY